MVNTSDGRVVRAFHRFTLVDQTGQGRDLTKGRRRDQVNEQVHPLPTRPSTSAICSPLLSVGHCCHYLTSAFQTSLHLAQTLLDFASDGRTCLHIGHTQCHVYGMTACQVTSSWLVVLAHMQQYFCYVYAYVLGRVDLASALLLLIHCCS